MGFLELPTALAVLKTWSRGGGGGLRLYSPDLEGPPLLTARRGVPLHGAQAGLRCSASQTAPAWERAARTKGTVERTNC